MGLFDAPSDRRRRKYRGWTHKLWLYGFGAVNALIALRSTSLASHGRILCAVEALLLLALTFQAFRSTRPWKVPLLIVIVAPFLAQMLTLGRAFPPPGNPFAIDATPEVDHAVGSYFLALVGYGALEIVCVITFAASWAIGAFGPRRLAVAEVFE